MTKCVYFFLCNAVVASCTVRTFGKTCFGTSRSYCFVNYHIVAKCVYFFLCNNVVASCAMRAFGKTCFGTCRIYCLVNYHIVTKCFALCLTYGANCGSLASCACPSVIFLNACGLRLSCLIPSHIEAIAGLKLSDILALLFSILTSTAEDKALNTYGNFNLVDVVTFYALSNGILKINAGPSCVISGFAIPVEEVYCGPCPVVFEVNSYCIFEIKLAAYGANTIFVYVIAKLGVFRINNTALAVLTLQASCRLCVLTSVRNGNCNLNSRTVEGDNNDATVFTYCVRLILTGICNVPSVVTSNLERISSFCNVLIYLGPYAVSIGHIVSCVGGFPLCAEMRAASCYCEGSRTST